MFTFNQDKPLWLDFNPYNYLMYVELALSLVLIISAIVFVFKTIKRIGPKVMILLLSFLTIVSWVFSLTFVWAITLSLIVVHLVISYTVNIGEVRPYLSNTLTGRADHLFRRKHKYGPIFDKEELYDKIEATVRQLSKTSTGGLITFERNTELTDYAKTGTILNAPVSAELLVTIFYPGTRLHDGAVIIRRDTIYAAACYYDPITTGLTGKYGSRHRAALGISKATDSVTIVVSEETGRVSLAVNGELIHVALDEFRRLFEEYMASEAKETK